MPPLVQDGSCQRLGADRPDLKPKTLNVLQDTDVLPLVRDGSCWTLGADSPDIDHEAAWRQSLRRDHRCRFKGKDCTPSRAAAPACAMQDRFSMAQGYVSMYDGARSGMEMHGEKGCQQASA